MRAVGTAFSIRCSAGGADVLVTEGVVRARSAGHEGQAALLAAGIGAYVADDATVAERLGATAEVDRRLAWREGRIDLAGQSLAEVDRRLAWREGRIDLAGQSLAEAFAKFNRYNARRIVTNDDTVGAKRLYGVFRTDDPEGFARAAASSLRVEAHGTASGNIVIRERSVAP